ncbi:hypothetical protein [Streptomyces solicathayae]|uniref:Uncharacterized protein n=1 Tax=Streptomyces solicathayae TaxID=3081768 RepID=A0ABZ0LX63_9ACTN|nr:hypothetical protein [Streptomyces sp. HUAS YS2]WOX24084.1 hypothetical protein R2D22_22970 [Streptomyces sp. HUAS YS2]
MKRFTSAALVAATAVLGTLLAPGTAQAADPVGGINISAGAEGIEIMSVGAMPAFVAHIRKKDSETRVQTVTEFTYSNDCSTSCMEDWYRSGPLSLADLGLYTVDIEYKGTEGETILRKDVAELDYRALARFQNTTVPKAVNLDSLSTTVSSDLVALDPRDGKTTPLAGKQVTVAFGSQSRTVSTDAAGHLIAPVDYAGTESSNSVRISLKHVSTANGTGSVTVAPTVERQQVKIVLDEDSRSVTAPYGTYVTIRGGITRTAKDGTQRPVASPMRITIPNTYLPEFTSDAAGRFSKAARVLKSSTWKASAGYQQPWLDYNTAADITATVTAGTAFTNEGIGIDKYRKVWAEGILVQRATSAAPGPATVELQYSADGRTAWSTRKTVDTVIGKWFNLPTLENAPVDGYWRLRYAGKADLAGSTSTRIRLTKTVTTVAEFNANPEPVLKGQYLTLTGKLKQRAASSTTWQPYGAQTVRFYFKPAGSTAYGYMGSTTTAADGGFSRKFTAKTDGTWQAQFYDNGTTHFASRSREDVVDVTG